MTQTIQSIKGATIRFNYYLTSFFNDANETKTFKGTGLVNDDANRGYLGIMLYNETYTKLIYYILSSTDADVSGDNLVSYSYMRGYSSENSLMTDGWKRMIGDNITEALPPKITYFDIQELNENNEFIEWLQQNAEITFDAIENPDVPEIPSIPPTEGLKYKSINALLKGIADSIRTKKGTTNLINKQNLPDEILSIAGGSVEYYNGEVEDGISYVYVEDDYFGAYKFSSDKLKEGMTWQEFLNSFGDWHDENNESELFLWYDDVGFTIDSTTFNISVEKNNGINVLKTDKVILGHTYYAKGGGGSA